jgi:hypothetical protein
MRQPCLCFGLPALGRTRLSKATKIFGKQEKADRFDGIGRFFEVQCRQAIGLGYGADRQVTVCPPIDWAETTSRQFRLVHTKIFPNLNVRSHRMSTGQGA